MKIIFEGKQIDFATFLELVDKCMFSLIQRNANFSLVQNYPQKEYRSLLRKVNGIFYLILMIINLTK